MENSVDTSRIISLSQELMEQSAVTSEKAAILTEEIANMHTEITPIIVMGVDPFIYAITIFALACFVGYYVVWKVTPALHTPLMSVTNAVSSIIVIGAILAAGAAASSFANSLGLLAVFIASINIFGGFVVTQRMLLMFKKR